MTAMAETANRLSLKPTTVSPWSVRVVKGIVPGGWGSSAVNRRTLRTRLKGTRTCSPMSDADVTLSSNEESRWTLRFTPATVVR